MAVVEQSSDMCERSRIDGRSAYYDLQIPVTGLAADQIRDLFHFVRMALPSKSIGESDKYWRLALADNGVVHEIPLRSGVDPEDIPYNWPCEEVYQHLWQQFSNLGVQPPPPELQAWDGAGWWKSLRLEREIADLQLTLKGWFKGALAAIRIGQEFSSVSSVLSRKEHWEIQMALLRQWIDDRVADGTLLAAILKQSDKQRLER